MSATDQTNTDTTGEAQSPAPAGDACPAWADKVLLQLKELEIKLGNLRPAHVGKKADDKAATWTETSANELWRRSFDEHTGAHVDEATVEQLFRHAARGLSKEGHSPAAIAAFVNARVKDAGGLPYCNADEVREALDGAD